MRDRRERNSLCLRFLILKEQHFSVCPSSLAGSLLEDKSNNTPSWVGHTFTFRKDFPLNSFILICNPVRDHNSIF